MSEKTKKCKRMKNLFLTLSLLANFLPLVIYIFKGFIEGETVAHKIGLTTTLMVAAIMTLLNFIFKFKIRSIIWVLLLGIHICVDRLIVLIVLIAICTILDEFILHPAYKKYRERFVINNEMDERL